MLRRRPGLSGRPRGSQGGWCQAAKRKQERRRQRYAGEAQLRRAGRDGRVGVEHDEAGVPPREAVPPFSAERVERRELGPPVVRLDVVVPERREPGRLAHHGAVRAEDVAVEQLLRALRIRVVADGEHEVRVPRLDQRGNRRLVARPTAVVAHDGERELRGARRRRPESPGRKRARAVLERVAVARAGGQVGQPHHMLDAAARRDAGAVLQEHGRAVGRSRAERDDRAALGHALDDRAAGQCDGGDCFGEHSLAYGCGRVAVRRSTTSASLRTRPAASQSLQKR